MKRYNDLLEESKSANESNDCAIIALSLFLDRPYNEILFLADKMGRRRRSGTPHWITKKIIHDCGKDVIYHYRDSKKYADFHSAAGINGKYILTRHLDGNFADDFIKLFGRKAMVRVSGHIAAVVDGIIEDWSIKRSLRIESIISFDEVC